MRLLASAVAIAAMTVTAQFGGAGSAFAQDKLVNVSYDPTRELYRDYADYFAQFWKQKTGRSVEISNSHGGSGAQVRSVIDGLPADVVTFPLEGDILGIQQKGLINPDWKSKFPDNASPYTSTIVFLVRKGNPKGIKDWDDLAKRGISVITPNPKTSGGARWNYLAAWAYELDRTGGDQKKAQDFVAAIYRNVPVLDTGARGSTNTFVQNKVGDVLIAWENEALLSLKEFGADYEIVVPSVSILAEVKVAIVDKNVDKKGTRELATAFLEQLYSPGAQKLFAKHFYRPGKPEHADPADLKAFPKVKLVKIDDVFGGWAKAQPTHFDNGGIFDKIYSKD
jgi:sulfate/thiosulfate-binding protein